MKWYQHGDVTIKPVKSIPQDAIKENHNVLMDGEVTGHKHQVIGKHNIFTKEGILYLQADNQIIVKHEEHKSMTIPAGNYKINRVREYDFFEEEIRSVRD